jgi:MinD-like ATPase involved in chromosome partitioning or flagellar assembly
MEDKRITLFTGNFGSGKTEISLNYALHLRENNKKVAVVDLDVINPYFRSRAKSELMEDHDVEVIYPKKLKHADLPVITADIKKLLQNEEYYGVIDVGGDEDGATVLGSIADSVKETAYELNLVVNTKRPFTDNVEGIIKMKEKIESASKIKVDNLICNINLGEESSIQEIKKGYPIIKEASKELDLPIKFIAIKKDLVDAFDKLNYEEEVFPIDRLLKNPWE